jgi:hypothetical protein
MRFRLTIAAAVPALALLLPAAPPAYAQFGAIAYDGKTGRYGASANKPTPKRAITAALGDCGASGCRIVGRVGPKRCGAVAAAADSRKGFGAAVRPALDQARFAALADCNKAKAGECVVKFSFCNK